MTRAEHLEWCKQRAREYVDRGELDAAVISMLSDLNKHEETEALSGPMFLIGVATIRTGDALQVRRFIEGFN